MKPEKSIRSSLLLLASSVAMSQISYSQSHEINPAGAIPSNFTLAQGWEWSTDADLEGWSAGANGHLTLGAGTPVGGLVTGTAAGGDSQFLSPDTTIQTSSDVIIEMRIKRAEPAVSRIDLFWDDAAGGFGGPRLYNIPVEDLSPDGVFHTIRITLPEGLVAGQLDRLRLDPLAEPSPFGGTMELDYFRVYTNSLQWDSNSGSTDAQGGTGTWDELTSSLWWTGVTNTTWPASGAAAIFGGTAGTVTVAGGGVTASRADFNTSGYVIEGGAINVGSTTASYKSVDSVNTRIDSALEGTAPLSLIPGSQGGFALGGDNTGLTGGITLVNRSIGIITDTALGTGTLTLGTTASGGASFISALDGARTIANDVTFGGVRTVVQSNAGVAGFPGDLGTGLTVGNLTVNGGLALDSVAPGDLFLGAKLTVNGVVSGSNNGIGLLFDGTSGNMELSNSGNTFTGGITWKNNSVLLVSSDGAMGDSANNLLFSAGILSGTGSATLKTTAGITSSREITISGAGNNARIDTNGFDSTWAGEIQTNSINAFSQFKKLGTGRLTLTTATSNLGIAGVLVSGGVLEIASGSLASGGNLANGVSAGATLEVTGGDFQTGNFVVGLSPGTATFNLDGGTYTNGAEFIAAFGGNGIVNINGGLANLNQFSMTNGDGHTSTMNLNGGDVSLNFFNDRGGLSNTGTAVINFNGSNIIAESNRDTGKGFIETDTPDLTVNVRAGGAIIDSAGFNLLINTPLKHDAALGGTLDGGLAKKGAGTLTLAGANTYTGPTTVTAGILSVSGDSIIDTGKLDITSGKVLIPAPANNEVVDTLFFNGVQQAAGVYGSTASSAANKNNTYFDVAGTGTLTVNSGPGGSAYDTWIATYPGVGAMDGPNDNPDNDSLSNFGEFAFGGDPTSGSDQGPNTSQIDTGKFVHTIAVRIGASALFAASGAPLTASLDGADYSIRGSKTLATFGETVNKRGSVVLGSLNPTPPTGYEYVTFELDDAVSGNPEGFLQATAGQTP